MALRRKLPSRSTPDSTPESVAAPQKQADSTLRETPRIPVPASVEAPVEATYTAPEPLRSEAFAAAASAAFSTLPSAPARVLEDSFTSATPTILPEPESQPEPTPAPSLAQLEPAPVMETVIVTNAPVEIVVETSSPFLPEPVVQPEPQIEAQAPVIEEATAPAIVPSEPEPESVAAAEEPAEPTNFNFEPSRPDNAAIKRRVREKRPRDFSAMGAPENQPAERPKPAVAFAPTVPVDTKPLDQVDESLIATGIMEAPPADTLTGSLPGGLAETSASTFAPLPEVSITPMAPIPAPQPEPVPVTIAPAPLPAAPTIPTFTTPAPQPVAIPAPSMAPTNLTAPASVPAPSFNLASSAPQPAMSAPLPPPQSDLPWTQTQSTAEWEIDTPQSEGHWDAGNQAEGSPAAHMPPPTDLYKPLPPALPGTNSGAVSGMGFGAGLTPRAGAFTPELPGQRRKQAGTPWALIVVAGLVAVGAGAFYFRSGGSQSQQQLANLTTPSQNAQNGDLLPPPANVSFYTPSIAAVSGSTVSSSAIVNFADIPAGEANQPIVADGTEEPPKDSGILARFENEIDKARAAKQGVQVAETSTTTPTGAPVEDVKKDIQAEIAAYRSALAQSPNPAALTPNAFKKDPDGYMDGKAQADNASGQGTPTGGAILPPPDGASGNLLPPPELYTNNPKNLPVVSEPVANAPARVRTLADFPDVEPYMPEKDKVEIPRNLKPKMAATDFPSLEILSFVPDKGIVAFADGREGVLLIGESINGWELVGVTPSNAEFRAGQKSYTVTAQN